MVPAAALGALVLRGAYLGYKGYKRGGGLGRSVWKWSRAKKATQKSGKVVQGELKTGKTGGKFIISPKRGSQPVPKDAKVTSTLQRKAGNVGAIGASGYALTRGPLKSTLSDREQERADLHRKGKGGYDIYKKGSVTARSFKKAFDDAVKVRSKGGAKVFTWRGRKYKAE